ncbi:hypothetical protein [Nannocystis pusilla]|uniref:hypothetical protein n=1 Tax=Nannocystis pusilla TaxID=889268 RepID=UPI003B80E49F
MSKVLAFTQATKLVSPSIDGGLPDGMLLQLWIRRTGDAASQTIVELAGAKTRIVLGTGDRADVLRFSVITGKSGPELTIPGGLPLDRWVQVRAGIGPEGKGWIRVNGMAYAEGPCPRPARSRAPSRSAASPASWPRWWCGSTRSRTTSRGTRRRSAPRSCGPTTRSSRPSPTPAASATPARTSASTSATSPAPAPWRPCDTRRRSSTARPPTSTSPRTPPSPTCPL